MGNIFASRPPNMVYLISTCRTGHRMYRLHNTENIRWYYFISIFLFAVGNVSGCHMNITGWVFLSWTACDLWTRECQYASSLSPPFTFLDFFARPFLSEVSLLEWWVKWFQVLDILPSWQVAIIALKETTSLHFR